MQDGAALAGFSFQDSLLSSSSVFFTRRGHRCVPATDGIDSDSRMGRRPAMCVWACWGGKRIEKRPCNKT